MNDYLALFLGVILAATGGELFVRGSVGLANCLRVSPGIIAATVAAFATSSPELSVSVNAALAGHPQIALGDALGSNVVNIALILGVALLISAIKTPRGGVKRDFPMALLVPVVTGMLFLDGELSRIDGALMFTMFLFWLGATVFEANKQRAMNQRLLAESSITKAIFSCVSCMASLVAAGMLIVAGAKGIATAFGIDEFIIGASIVAIGTSVPELATTVIAKLRGHDEVGLGTILGSNIYNGIFIVSVAAMIHPITVPWRDVVVALVFGFMALIFAYPNRDGVIEKRRGFILLALYLVYVAAIVQLQGVA